MWFRVELNRDGSVIKAEHVESKLPGAGRFVVYVDAETQELAMASAVSRYQRYLEKQRTDLHARRETRKAQGRCRDCGKPCGARMCAACTERSNALQRKRRGWGDGGGDIAPRPRGAHSQREIILAEILEQALALRAGVAFLSWLRLELEAARSVHGKAQAAE